MLLCFQVFLRGGSHTEVEVVQGEFKRASENKELGVFLLEGACTLLHKLALIFCKSQTTAQYLLLVSRGRNWCSSSGNPSN